MLPHRPSQGRLSVEHTSHRVRVVMSKGGVSQEWPSRAGLLSESPPLTFPLAATCSVADRVVQRLPGWWQAHPARRVGRTLNLAVPRWS